MGSYIPFSFYLELLAFRAIIGIGTFATKGLEDEVTALVPSAHGSALTARFDGLRAPVTAVSVDGKIYRKPCIFPWNLGLSGLKKFRFKHLQPIH